MAIFLIVVLAVLAGIHWFIYRRLAHGLSLGPAARRSLVAALALGMVAFLLGEILHRRFGLPWLQFAGSVWLGTAAILFSTLLPEWALSSVFPGARGTLVRLAAILALVLSAVSLWRGLAVPRVREVELAADFLPEASPRYTVVQLSDLHLDGMVSERRLRGFVDQVRDLAPDLIVITGDLFDGDVSRAGRYRDLLGRLRARDGVVVIPGNHEYYAGIETLRLGAARFGWKMLRNSGFDVGPFYLAGLDDEAGQSFGFSGPRLDQALAGNRRKKPVLLLRHRPFGFAEARAAGVFLMLAGHTHAGQIPPMDLLVRMSYRYPVGAHHLAGATIVTSAGTGTWGPPMRLFSRSEIGRIVLLRRPGGGDRPASSRGPRTDPPAKGE
ncbi:MAG TPA: metallophosphoesterase [Candidatus Aminicenantes bacterium]|nr:metallophosphoesterase [Candidatus Aminicenantes bacterium]